MKALYARLEKIFEQITFGITAVISSPITFVLVLIMIVFWFTNRDYSKEPINETIRDTIHGVSFITVFIIQRAFNHFTASIHIKLDELVASNENASNAVLNAESKPESEIIELKEEYNELAQQTETDDSKDESRVDESGKNAYQNKTDGIKT